MSFRGKLMRNEEVKGGERKKRVQRDDSIITHVINKALNRCGAWDSQRRTICHLKWSSTVLFTDQQISSDIIINQPQVPSNAKCKSRMKTIILHLKFKIRMSTVVAKTIGTPSELRTFIKSYPWNVLMVVLSSNNGMDVGFVTFCSRYRSSSLVS